MQKWLKILCFHFLVAAAIALPDKTNWPRLFPVIFVHGVNSSGKMWAFNLDESALRLKGGNYEYYNGEEETLTKNYPFGNSLSFPTTNANPSTLESVLPKGHGIGPLTFNDVYSCSLAGGQNPPCLVYTPDNVNRFNAAQENSEIGPLFDFKLDSIPFSAYYDKIQFDITGRSRNFQTPYLKFFGNPVGGDYSFVGWNTGFGRGYGPLNPNLAVNKRNNGLEGYTSFWQKSWADGNPPSTIGSATTGQLYGTYMVNKDYAPFAKYAVTCGSQWIPLSLTQWKPLLRPSAWESTCIGSTSPSYYTGAYVKSSPDAQGIITYQYTYTASSLPTRYITFVERPVGLVSNMFVEETKFGQIGQLYVFLKKVLDKYYVDPSGKPNWLTDNGQSDPDAKVVLFGHSQGGVISRSLLYPGFSSVNTFDSDPKQNYYPLYWPSAMVGYGYRDFNNSAQTLTKWFDPRNHVAAVVTTSSPHLGSPIGFVLEGLNKTHLTSLVDKTQNKGLYAPLISGHNIWNWDLNTQSLGTISANLDPVIKYLNPTAVPPPNLGWIGLTDNIVKSLRTNDLSQNPTDFVTYNMLNSRPKTPAEGLALWTQDGVTPAADMPCSPAGSNGDVGPWQNYYRAFWQPEYDNWIRSFRTDENNNGGIGSEKYLSANVSSVFFNWGRKLCEEQIGDFSRLTWNDSPYKLNTAVSNNADYNPFISLALAKRAATSTQASIPQAVLDAEACIKSVLGRSMDKVFSNPLLIPARIWAAPFYIYNRGMNCADQFQLNVNMSAAEMISELMTSGAQGLLFHPASQFLHKLNQVAGGSSAMDRRPYPVTPDGSPIPLISVTNSQSGNQFNIANLNASSSSDMVVPTLSQDMGVIYPDFAKAGSHVRVHFTGYSHTEIGRIDEKKIGPYFLFLNGQPTDYDTTKNKTHHRQTKNTLANILLGLASGQSSLILNPNGVGATRNEIEAQYTTPVYDAGATYRLQRNTAGVQGTMSRLKGMDKRLIKTPVVLPFDRTYKIFYLNYPITVEDGQELFLPAGSTLEFRSGGSITVKSGGEFTFGGTPSYVSSGDTKRLITLKGATALTVPITFSSASILRYPNSSSYRYYLAVGNEITNPKLRFKSVGTKLERSSDDIYKAEYDESPYITISMPSATFAQCTYNPAAVGAAQMLLNNN